MQYKKFDLVAYFFSACFLFHNINILYRTC